MDWLMLNPIADMYGPHFLILYSIVIVITLLACYWRMRVNDPTQQLPPLPIPANPDPYEVAYLRGGENEVSRLVIFNLIEQGYLYIHERKGYLQSHEKKLEQVQDHPDPRQLAPIERKVFSYLSGKVSIGSAITGLEYSASLNTAGKIFNSPLPAHVKDDCAVYEQRLQNERLLNTDEMKGIGLRVGIDGAIPILFLGGYKLIVALEKGHRNVLFLIGMGIISLIFLGAICKPHRLSYRGQDYLNRLQKAFELMKANATGWYYPYQTTYNSTSGVADSVSLLLLMAIHGIGILAGTEYYEFIEMFAASKSGGGGCGGGCGGGGCGGCGGCGG